MRTLLCSVTNFVKREEGPTAVEYAVMLALIVAVCITAITSLGASTNSTFLKAAAAAGKSGGS